MTAIFDMRFTTPIDSPKTEGKETTEKLVDEIETTISELTGVSRNRIGFLVMLMLVWHILRRYLP